MDGTHMDTSDSDRIRRLRALVDACRSALPLADAARHFGKDEKRKPAPWSKQMAELRANIEKKFGLSDYRLDADPRAGYNATQAHLWSLATRIEDEPPMAGPPSDPTSAVFAEWVNGLQCWAKELIEQEQRSGSMSHELLQYQFRLDGACWRLRFGDETGTYPNDNNFPRIAALLRQPDRKVSALSLMGANELLSKITHTSQPATDEEGRAARKRRCEELVEEIKQARARGDRPLEKELQDQLSQLLDQVRRDTGLNGQARRIDKGSPAQKAAAAVRKSKTRVIELVKHTMPQFAKYLGKAIQAHGVTYIYHPDDLLPWHF
jgi:hypothetical protein